MTKSNTQLQQDVQLELKYEPSVDAAEIGVTAKDGIVGLNRQRKELRRKVRGGARSRKGRRSKGCY